MPEKVAGLWLVANVADFHAMQIRPLFAWGIEEPAVLLKATTEQAERIARWGFDIRPARVGYYGDEDAGVWLDRDGALTEGQPVTLAGRFG